MSEHGPRAKRPAHVITEPGIYDLPAEVYHADPCETPSLSAGMINDILLAPAKCYANSPRLNIDWEEPDADSRFSIGSVSHVMFLEPHLFAEKVTVVEADDWRTEAAKQAREEAADAGKTAILAKHMQKVRAARTEFLCNPFTSAAFEGGTFERSVFWRHPVYGFWCRARPDFIADNLHHLCDYKATSNANPLQFGKHAFSLGYHRRAAWYLDGMLAATGRRPAHYWFANQETSAPYLTSICELDAAALEEGRRENARASELFAHCLQTGEWHGYRHKADTSRDLAFTVSLPNYAYMQIEERI